MDLAYFKKKRFFLNDLRKLPVEFGNFTDLLLASFSINILSLALPIVLMQVYDRIVPTHSTSTLLWLVVGFFVALFFESILRLCRFTITNWMAARFEHTISVDCVSNWLNSMVENFESDGAGVHLDRLRAVNALRGFYAGQAFQIMLDLPFAFIFLAVIGFLGGWYTAGYVGGAALLYFVIITFIKQRYSKNRKRQKILGDRRYNFLVEALSGIHTIKSVTLEEQMLRRHERLEADVAKSDYDVISVGALPMSLGNLFSQGILFMVLFLGGTNVINGDITIGSLAACTLLSGRFFQPLRTLASFWVRHADVEIAQSQIKDIAALPQESDLSVPCLPNEIDGWVHLEQISFRYNENLPWTLKNLDMTIVPKRMVCIHHNMSHGSTTLLNIIYGMLTPEQGRVFIDNHNMASTCHTDFKGRIEYIPQQGTLFNGTIFDNLTLFNPALREAALDAAALLDLDDVVSELPLGYETHVGNRLYEFLSTGIIQRICLARALTVRPRILLLDKVNDSMDSESEQLFFWLLNKLKGNCTIIMVTNNQQILEMADEVYQLRDGSLTQVETNQCF